MKLLFSADMKRLYNVELGVYFIDRNRTAFEHILQYMASDKKIYQASNSMQDKLSTMAFIWISYLIHGQIIP